MRWHSAGCYRTVARVRKRGTVPCRADARQESVRDLITGCIDLESASVRSGGAGDAGHRQATFGRCEFFVGDAADQLGKGEPTAKATFGKDKKPQQVKCEPVKARYFMVRVLAEVNDGPWASMAEIGALSR